jgi:hypothetical protein
MKASEMISLLAKQIQLNGDREVRFVGNKIEAIEASEDVEYDITSITNTPKHTEIYGE